MSTFTMDDYRLARAHGATSYMPGRETYEQGAVRSALRYARDLKAFRDDPLAFCEWERESMPWDGDVPYDGPLYSCILLVTGEGHDEVVGSLGMIAVPDTDDPYCRIVEAELYGDYRHEVERKAAAEQRERDEREHWAARDTITC